jgi:hypothetical protein
VSFAAVPHAGAQELARENATSCGFRGLIAGMKPTPLVILLIIGSSLLTTTPAFAQGKGHGGGSGHSAGNAPMMPAEPRANPARSNDKSVEADKASERRGQSVTGETRSARSPAQELSASLHDINQSAFAQRKQLHDTLDMRLKSSRDALKEIQSEAKDLRGAARDEFKSSLAAVKDREKELNHALKATNKSTEATWEKDRAELSQAYQHYTDAVAHAESVARTPKP